MMDKCDQYPGREAFQDMTKVSEESDALPANINFKQCTTNERTVSAEMIIIVLLYKKLLFVS